MRYGNFNNIVPKKLVHGIQLRKSEYSSNGFNYHYVSCILSL